MSISLNYYGGMHWTWIKLKSSGPISISRWPIKTLFFFLSGKNSRIPQVSGKSGHWFPFVIKELELSDAFFHVVNVDNTREGDLQGINISLREITIQREMERTKFPINILIFHLMN
jgi:hypothetical protein